jgi:transposase-like protein
MKTFKNENETPVSHFTAIELKTAVFAARVLLSDVSIEDIAKLSGLPESNVNAAFRNIFQGSGESGAPDKLNP